MQQTSTKQRKQRSDTGTRLTDRDLLVLKVIGEQYALAFNQLQILLGAHAKAETVQSGKLSESATRHAIDRWKDAGLVGYQKILADLPGVVWLTPRGLHAVSLPFQKYRPAPSGLQHVYQCAQVRLWLAHEHPEWSWTSERWQRAQADQKIKRVKVPDALLTLQDDRVIAIEVELTQKNATTLQQIIKDRAITYGQTWYFAQDRVHKALKTAIEQLDPTYQQRVQIFSLEILDRKPAHE